MSTSKWGDENCNLTTKKLNLKHGPFDFNMMTDYMSNAWIYEIYDDIGN